MQRSPATLLVSMVPSYNEEKIKIPPGQREGKIWTLDQKQWLIDSLYNDFDIPKIYLRQDQKNLDVWYLVDGQQRVEAICDFINNKFSLADETSTLPANVRGRFWKDLRPEDKQRIGSRTIDAIVYITQDESEEEDMFLRLNNGTRIKCGREAKCGSGRF